MEVKPLNELRDLMQKCEKNKSLAKKHLTVEMVTKYANTKSPLGGTLAQCVNTNAYNAGALLPRCADLSCYDTFVDFFDNVIKDYHKVSGAIAHPKSNFGDLNNLGFTDLDPSGEQVVSTRVRCGRTVKGFGFAPVITKEDRIKLEEKVATALKSMTGEFAGTYYPLLGMKKEDQDKLIADHFLFRDDDSVLRDAGGYRDWPSGRGIFISNSKNFLVWINEEDHIRIISMQKGGDLAAVYKRLGQAVEHLSKALEFAFSDKLGFLTFCPSNLGTTLRASVHAKVPFLASLPNFKEICESYGIQARGTFGEHTESVGGVYDLSNKRRLGLTELNAVKEMNDGVKALLALEKKLASCNDTKFTVPVVESLACMHAMMEQNKDSKSLSKKYLTSEIVKEFEGKRTPAGTLLSHCVRNCAYNGRALCPRTGDKDCYTVFEKFLDAVIRDYHSVKDASFKHPPPTFGDLENLPFGDIDPSGKYVVSTRVRVGRSVEGFDFPVCISKDDRLKLEKTVSEALKSLTGDHAGTYHPLVGMNPDVQKQLIDDHFLFKDDDPVLRDAFGYRHWPTGRGIFHNAQKTFLVWVCEEDHLRIISMQKGGDLAAVYKRLISGIKSVETKMKFAHSDKYGYLTCCPSNLGTTMRASVHVKVPKLSSNKTKFQEVCDKYNLQARGFRGEHTESADGIYDISNKRRLGLTELEAATEMANGVAEIIKIEMAM